MTYVVNLKNEKYDIYIGRPTIFGNPFSHVDYSRAEFKVKTREEAIAKYAEWIKTQPDLIEKIRKELKNKVLGCFCKPLACHGDILAQIADELC